MNVSVRSGRGMWIVTAAFAGLLVSGAQVKVPLQAADPAPPRLATVAEAAKVIDISKLPLPAGAEKILQQSISGVRYRVPGNEISNLLAFYQKILQEQKWTEVPNGRGETYARCYFLKQGYSLTLDISNNRSETTTCELLNQGNIDFTQLPLPAGAERYPELGAQAFLGANTKEPAEVTTDAVKKVLAKAGWKPFGASQQTLMFKQNAVVLMVVVSATNPTNTESQINYRGHLMEFDFAVAPGAIDVEYSDRGANVCFYSKKSPSEIAKFYQKELAKGGWKSVAPPAHHAGNFSPQNALFFRNSLKSLFSLCVDDDISNEGKTKGAHRVILQYESVARQDELVQKLKKK